MVCLLDVEVHAVPHVKVAANFEEFCIWQGILVDVKEKFKNFLLPMKEIHVGSVCSVLCGLGQA